MPLVAEHFKAHSSSQNEPHNHGSAKDGSHSCLCLTFKHERSIEEVNADHCEEADDGEFIVAVRGIRSPSADTDMANGDDDQPEFGVV